MARYIKANPKVAQYLRLENDRNRVADGNYLLWQADMLAFGKLTDLPLILGQIGAIALAAHEAREEQDGTVIRELPVAEDPRFVVEPAEEPETEEPTEGDEPAAEDPEAGQDPQPETEAPAEDPEAGSEEPVEDPAGETEPTDQEPEAEPEQPAEIEVPAEDPETETTNDETEI